MRQRRSRRGEARVAAHLHRGRARVRRLARESKAQRSTPTQPVTAAARRAGGLHPGPLLDVELEVGAERPRDGAPDSSARSRLDAVLGEHVRQGHAIGVRRSRTASGSSVPEKQELPNRLRPKRAPSSSAQSTRTSGRGGGSDGVGAQHAERGHHAEGAVEPAAVGHRVEVRADGQRRGGGIGALEPVPRGCPPRRSRAATPISASSSAEQRPRLEPGVGPAEALGPAIVAGPSLRARAGRRSPGRRRPARRMLTRVRGAAPARGSARRHRRP